ncbi:DUF559 domain-containing protein [Robertkochia marina]|uniref:DUF559 domain-containing protein n=1 Tax=Robertkochia marina TaxID=1227945 RepID=A0A4S3M3T7_9FLAO|nr:endonuclease domain-containing protein [Robertkochia marina]THD69753.1 DUF559 domain-containing protein [Robertkochia marina]TRZ46904.1 DUF559 domain-containing protein [Robertkochia marina]
MRSNFNRKYQTEYRRKLRNEATLYERTLWSKLRGRQLEGRKFRRQAGIGKYIADFYCPSEKMIVELEGPYHYTDQVNERDKERELYFKKLGIKVLRIPNPHSAEALRNVLNEISSQFRPE